MLNVVMYVELENIVGIEGMKGYYQALLLVFFDG